MTTRSKVIETLGYWLTRRMDMLPLTTALKVAVHLFQPWELIITGLRLRGRREGEREGGREGG